MRDRRAAPVTTRSGLRKSADAAAARAPHVGRWWVEVLLAVGLYVVYDLVHGAVTGNADRAYRNGHDLLRWEQALHLDPEHALASTLVHVPVLAVPACYFYAALHFAVTPVVLGWAFARRPQVYRQARAVLVLITFAALVGFWLFPAAPPRLLPGNQFVDVLAHYHSWGWWAADSSLPAAGRAFANPFAAMPSLHVAWACWCGATVFRAARHRIVRVLAVAYPVVTAAVVLATGNHYLLDVVAGAALWFAGTALVGWFVRLRVPSAAPPPAAPRRRSHDTGSAGR